MNVYILRLKDYKDINYQFFVDVFASVEDAERFLNRANIEVKQVSASGRFIFYEVNHLDDNKYYQLMKRKVKGL